MAMQPVKDSERVNRMLEKGQTTILDPSTGYKYSITACCPADGSFSSISEIEKSGESITRTVFRCPQCANPFESKPEDIYLW